MPRRFALGRGNPLFQLRLSALRSGPREELAMSVTFCADWAVEADGAAEAASRQTHPLSDLDQLAETINYRAGEKICDENRTSEYWWRIIAGAARRWRS